MKLMDAVIDNLKRGLIIYQDLPNRPIIYANDCACQILGMDSVQDLMEFYQYDYSNVLYSEDLSAIEERIRIEDAANGMGPQSMSYRMRDKQGRLVVMKYVGQFIEDEEYGPVCAVMFRPQQADAIAYRKEHITGLPGMREFLDYAEAFAKDNSDKIADLHVSVAFFDIRHFKPYNIKYGIKEGDDVLRTLANILREHFADGFISRFSDDHFVALATTEDIIQLVTAVHDDFAVEYAADSMEVKVGIYYLEDETVSFSTACDFAKMACDDIHRSVDVYYRIFDDKLIEKHDIANYVVHNLDKAIENKYIKVYYQPVVRTISGDFCGMEALARWDDPEKGLLSPAYFIQALEDNRLIAKLDMYMIEEICAHMRKCLDEGLPVVPTSFNLSRIDFSTCDVFEEVEATLARYAIPRNMIRVEVTESMMVKENAHVQEELMRFKSMGYQVWMDDFGSGYSALNVLKDFDYDEIKIDMAFLSSFTEKSKSILRSIVTMAKSIGVQTLAEGVETEEQYEFLRDIGCEKVQGYYFGKPMPAGDVLAHSQKRGMSFETPRWENYYDKIGHIDTDTGKRCGIFSTDGKTIKALHINAGFWEILNTAGIETIEQVEFDINNNDASLKPLLLSLHQSILAKGMPSELDFAVNNHLIRIRATHIASNEEQHAYYVEIINHIKQENLEYRNYIERISPALYGLFSAVSVADLSDDSIHHVLNHGYFALDEYVKNEKAKLHEVMHVIEVNLIHPEDQEAYHEYMDLDTLASRVSSSEKGYLAELFRTKKSNGTYIWMEHRVIAVNGTDHTQFVFAIMESSFINNGTLERVIGVSGFNIPEEVAKDAILWRAISKSPLAKIYWKDANGRFVGVNQNFLDYFGCEDTSEIIGKTGEELGWCVNNKQFYQDDAAVLNHAEIVANRPGKCIVKGVQKQIITTRVPLFRNGQVEGLVGYLIDLDEQAKEKDEALEMQKTDPVTGLMNNFGMMIALTDYTGAWQLKNKRFAYIRIRLHHLSQSVNQYGEEVTNDMLRVAGQIIQETAGSHATCGRTYSGNFNILTQYQNRDDVDKLCKKICKQLINVHSVDGFPVTLYLDTNIVYAEQMQSSADIFSMISEGER